MSEPRRDEREQEISIRQREGELFRREVEASSTARPFSEYLQETPAHPLPAWAKATLWAVGIVVILLFAASLWRLQSKPTPQPLRKGRARTSLRLERPSLFSLPVAGRFAPTNLETS